MRNAKLMVVFVLTQIILIGVLVWLFEIALARTASVSDSTTPHLISYQGVLTDESGNPINGTRAITMTVYDAESGGTALWQETFNNLTVANGIFSALLGSGSAIPDTLFDIPDRWLEIEVEGVTLVPRQRFTSVPYALNADKLDGLDINEITTPSETWKLGDAAVDNRTGVLSYGSYVYWSYLDTSDNINNFIPTYVTKTIQSASFLIISKSGSYTDTFTLDFEVRDFAGNLKHTVTASSIDFQLAPSGVWASVPLSSNPADLIVSPGEYLAVHVSRGGAPAGDLEIWSHYQAIVK